MKRFHVGSRGPTYDFERSLHCYDARTEPGQTFSIELRTITLAATVSEIVRRRHFKKENDISRATAQHVPTVSRTDCPRPMTTPGGGPLQNPHLNRRREIYLPYTPAVQ
ncbi:hypothetical protein EVAR_91744_1 [Eumeta japonica]|uniref:Uncharacterized protein n=1 Tax=Eumeta variegata TaxID=151549 RepID=A0A4C2AEM3_EUMVA|nr:hypothetical protein EVAR_91744_1 [Eumeta japonica]